MLTLLSLEIYSAGTIMRWRLIPLEAGDEGDSRYNPTDLELEVRDDRGNIYTVWPSYAVSGDGEWSFEHRLLRPIEASVRHMRVSVRIVQAQPRGADRASGSSIFEFPLQTGG
jgi:hypothetical protein